MGVDISAHTGVVVTAKALAGVIKEEHREQACRTILRYTATQLQDLKSDADSTFLEEFERRDRQDSVAMLTDAFGSLSAHTPLETLHAMLESMATPVTDGGSTWIKREREAIRLWSVLLSALYPGSPEPESAEFIDSPRYQGWELPQGEILYVFSEEACFQRVKTEAGRLLDRMLGEKTDLVTWTSYSV